MFDDDYLPSAQPFWFVRDELLTELLSVEVNAVNQLVANWPDFRKLFDDPEATVAQRTGCFELLAHRKVMGIIYEMFLARHEQSPSLGDPESKAISHTQDLVTRDAPAWVLEMNEVVDLLPYRINAALPKSLRAGTFEPNNSAQAEAVKVLSSVKCIQELTKEVFDQQLRRLEQRWSATNAVTIQLHQARLDQPQITKTYPLNPFEGLIRKNDLSRYSQYMDTFTEKQRIAFSLKFEYGLGLAKIASIMGIDRKTADEHIKAAEKKIQQARSNEKSKAHRAKSEPEF